MGFRHKVRVQALRWKQMVVQPCRTAAKQRWSESEGHRHEAVARARARGVRGSIYTYMLWHKGSEMYMEVRAQAQGVGSSSATDGNTYAVMSARPGTHMKRVQANMIQSKGS